MLWQDTAAKIRANPNADIVYVSSGGGYMDHVIKIIKLIGDRKVICINQCVSAAAFVVVCGDHEWENRGQLLLHMPEDANGEQDQPVNDWLEENCDLPDLSRTSLKLFWFVEGNDLNKGYFK